MSQSEELTMSAVDAHNLYLGHGNLRPPLPQLLAIDAALATSKYPTEHSTRADVLMDSAVCAPEYGEIFLNAAYGILERNTESLIDRATDESKTAVRFTKVNRLVECLFKLSLEQPWRQAIDGAPAQFDYPLMLSTACRANWFVDDSDWDAAVMADYLPLLLLARSQDSNGQDGPVGRLALTREDRRSSFSRRYPLYSNWTIGISEGSDATSFIEPDHRVSIRRTLPYPELTQKVNDAGVVLISAFRHRFGRTNALINGCLVEQGLSPINNSRPMPSSQLDGITGTILEDIAQQSAHIEQQEGKRREQDELSATESSIN